MSEWVQSKRLGPVLRVEIENEGGRVLHEYNDWKFSDADEHTAHAYMDALMDAMVALGFQQRSMIEAAREWADYAEEVAETLAKENQDAG